MDPVQKYKVLFTSTQGSLSVYSANKYHTVDTGHRSRESMGSKIPYELLFKKKILLNVALAN
jgi:hypothetical protein